MSQYSSRVPLDNVNNMNRDSYFSNQKTTTSIRQCVTTTSNMSNSYMKRSMSGTNIYSSQINVPPPQRQQMGKHMDVVCFLLACEVERFLAENDKLKYRIKEMDDKLLDRNSYEKQIEDLQARLCQSQYQESMYRQEIEITTTSMTQELEQWKVKCYQNDEKYKQEAESLRLQLLQGDQKKMKEIDDLKAQLSSYRTSYESELQKTKDQLQQRNQSIEYYQNELKQLEYQIRGYRLQDEKLKDYENKIALLVSETERLNCLLREKLECVEDEKKRNGQLMYENDKLKSDYRTLQQGFEKKQKDYDQLHQSLIINQNELVKYKDQEKIIEQLQNKIALLTSEIERLNQVLREKINQGEEWRSKYFTSENQCGEMRQKLQKLDNLQGQLKDQLDRLNSMAMNLEEQKKQNQIQSQTIQQQEMQNSELQHRVSILGGEIERLNNILKVKVHELEDYKLKNNNLETELRNKNSQFNDCKGKLNTLSSEIDRLQDVLKQKQNELNRINEEWKRKQELDQKKIIEYENKICLLTSEIERLNQVLQNKLLEVEDWKSKCRRVEQTFMINEDKLKQCQMRIILHCAEVDRLTSIQSDIFDENEQLQNQIQHYQVQIKNKDDQLYKALDRNSLLQKICDDEKGKRAALEQQIREGYEQKIAMLATENQRLSEQLRLKNGEIDDYRTSIQRYENKLNILNQEIERLNIQLKKVIQENENHIKELDQMSHMYQQLQRQYEELKMKYSSIEHYKSRYLDLENKCAMLSTEMERLQTLLSQKSDEIEQLKRKIQQLEQTIYQLRQYEENVRILSAEIDRLQAIIDQQEAELRTWRLQYADGEASARKQQDMLFHFVMMSAEIESLRGRVQEKEKEVEEVRRSSLAPYRR